jgi:hypothetical protein
LDATLRSRAALEGLELVDPTDRRGT